MISAPEGHPGEVRVMVTFTSPSSLTVASYTSPMSMMLRPSSGSLTARRAFFTESGVSVLAMRSSQSNSTQEQCPVRRPRSTRREGGGGGGGRAGGGRGRRGGGGGAGAGGSVWGGRRGRDRGPDRS